LKRRIYEDQDNCESNLRDDPRYLDGPTLDAYLDQLALGYRDWPIFPDPTSHWAHHLAQLAVLLSMPVEMCWGAPIYHFRAIRAACIGFLDAPAHPFVGNPGKPPNVPEGGEEPKDDGSIPGIWMWPLPLPRLHFLPNDHHHHWHINFWRSDLDPLPGDLRHRLPHAVRSHPEYIAACLPMWVMLGVNFKPFEQYLTEYKSRGVTDLLLDHVNWLLLRVNNDRERIEKSLPPEFRDNRHLFRQKLAALAVERYEDPDSLPEWPLTGSFLHQAIREARTLKAGLDARNELLRPDMQPAEIREALEQVPDRQAFEFQEAEKRLAAKVGDAPETPELQPGAAEARSGNLNEQLNSKDQTESAETNQ
jgi:hypothetical protein